MSDQKALVGNAADKAQVEEAAKAAKRGRAQEIDDTRSVLATSSGRRFVWRYLEECGVFKSSFNHSGSLTFFNEGARNIGLKLLADVNEASPEAYLQMTKESKGERNV